MARRLHSALWLGLVLLLAFALWGGLPALPAAAAPLQQAPGLDVSTNFPATLTPGTTTNFEIFVNNPAGGTNYSGVAINLRVAFPGAVAGDITQLQFRDDKGKYFDMPLSLVNGELVGSYNYAQGFRVPAPGGATNTVYFRIATAAHSVLSYHMDLVRQSDGVVLATTAGNTVSGTLPSLNAFMPASALMGQEVSFSVSAVNGATGINFAHAGLALTMPGTSLAEITSLQIQVGGTWQDVTLTPLGSDLTALISADFALAPAQTVSFPLRARFASVRSFTFNYRLLDGTYTPPVASPLATASATIATQSPATIGGSLPVSGGIFAPQEFTLSATNPLGGLPYSSVGIELTLGLTDPNLVSVQALVVDTWVDVPLTPVIGDLMASFPLQGTQPLAGGETWTLPLRVTYEQAGAYHLSAVLTDRTAPLGEMIDGLIGTLVIDAPELSGTLDGTQVVDRSAVYTLNLANPAAGSPYADASYRFTFIGASAADVTGLRYDDGSGWQVVTLTESNGDLLGASTPGALAAGDTREIKLEVTLAETGDFALRVDLIQLQEMLASVSGSLHSVALPTLARVAPEQYTVGQAAPLTLTITNPADGVTVPAARLELWLPGADVTVLESLEKLAGADLWEAVTPTLLPEGLLLQVSDLALVPGDVLSHNLRAKFAASGVRDYEWRLIDESASPLAEPLAQISGQLAAWTPPVIEDDVFNLDENDADWTQTLTATDADTGDTLTFALNDSSVFQIGATSGILSVKTPAALDFETTTSFTLTVTVTDSHGLSDTAVVDLFLNDLNEAPVLNGFISDQLVKLGEDLNVTLPADLFSDPDAGDSITLTVTLDDGTALPAWITYDETAGTISGTPTSADLGLVKIRVTATDQDSLSSYEEFSVLVLETKHWVYIPLAMK